MRSKGYRAENVLALACGFPPSAGDVSATHTISVLQKIGDELSAGFVSGIERLKQNAPDEQDIAALVELLSHLERRCHVLTAFERAPAAFYGPGLNTGLEDPPAWWRHLTVEKWSQLLEDSGDDEKEGISISVSNAITPTIKGGCALVLSEVQLTVEHDSGGGPLDVAVSRAGGRGSGSSPWEVQTTAPSVITDSEPPTQKGPLRYNVSASGYRQGTVKAISLENWTPGIYVTSRTAIKLTPTRVAKANKDKIALEAFLEVAGAGRHFIDLFCNSLTSVGSRVGGRDAEGDEIGEDNLSADVEVVSDTQAGFEIDIPGDCYLDVPFSRDKSSAVLRLHVTCADLAPASCGSEFEKAIALNTDERKSRHEVYVDRQVRSADFQAWMIDPAYATRSFIPVALAEDYAEAWAPPDWAGATCPVISAGAFLHDPRPAPSEFSPPEDFVRLRAALAERIRGDDGNGLIESAPLGEWMSRDVTFAQLVEEYLDAYLAWMGAEPSVAMWCDIVLVVSLSGSLKTLDQEPDAILVSPLHPIRLAWHCAAQQALVDAARAQKPCPAASIIDPDSILDSLCLPLRTADGDIVHRPFISVEVNSDYWGVLWNGSRLSSLDTRCQRAPFGPEMGLRVGGVSSGFSSAQVVRALDDTQSMFPAKARLAALIASSPSNSDACTAGITQWAKSRWSATPELSGGHPLGPTALDIYDTRSTKQALPGDTEISNLTEDTAGAVRWFSRRPPDAIPDIGIIAQLESSQPSIDDRSELRSPLSAGGLIRHRIRRQLPGGSRAFLSESRQAKLANAREASLLGKVATSIARIESIGNRNVGYSFAPNTHAIGAVLEEEKAILVAVSSSAVDPACFLGGWLQGAYLWDYDLPSFSRRAGDTNGYYLISKIQDSEREGLRKALARLPGAGDISDDRLRETLLEVSRRGIPTVRGISRGDTSGTGDLGLFVASRLLQDEFREGEACRSLLTVSEARGEGIALSLVIPVDPFRGYLDDVARALRKEKKEATLSRPDLLVVGVQITGAQVTAKLTPVEVKYRQGTMSPQSCEEALRQARSLSDLLSGLHKRALEPGQTVWELAFQHLTLSMIAFGMRVYSQRIAASPLSRDWSKYHELIASAVMSGELVLEVDPTGRLIIIDKSPASAPRDVDRDGFTETIVVSLQDASEIVCGQPELLFGDIRSRVADWGLLPSFGSPSPIVSVDEQVPSQVPTPPVGDIHIPPTQNRTPVAPPSETSSQDPLGGTTAPPVVLLAPSAAHQGVSSKGDAPSPDDSIGVVLELGVQADGFRPQSLNLNLSDTRLNQLNIGVVGDLGTGKTQLLKSLLFQLSASNGNAGVKPRVLIFDYKKDYSSPDFVQAVSGRVVLPQNLPLNIFDTSTLSESLTPWLDRFNFFADILDKIYSGIGPVQRSALKQAVRRAYEAVEGQHRQPTLYDIHAEYANALGGKSDAPFSIIEDLVDRQVFTRTPGDAASFDQFFDGVVVVSLNALGQDDRAKNMVVAVMLNMFYEHMLRIPKRPFRGTDPQLRVIDSYLLVDEADNIMKYEFDVLRKILLQGREFGVGVVLASQYLKHFKVNATDYREPLLTWFIHKVPNVTPQELSALGFTSDSADLASRVKSLPNHHCVYKSATIGGEVINGLPFYRLQLRS
jgi:hypothetical protein